MSDSAAGAHPFPKVWLATVLLLTVGGLPLLDLLLLPAPHDALTIWIGSIWARKVELARHTPAGPRLLLAGGSSSFFSLDAEVLQARLGRPVLNLGTNAGLDLRFLLDNVREVARPGDTVLLYLEDPHYARDPASIRELEHKVIWSHQLSRLACLPWSVLAEELYGQPLAAYQEGWRARNLALQTEHLSEEETMPYSSVEISPLGDFRGRLGGGELSFPPATPGEAGGIHPGASRALLEFFRWCEKRGIQVIGTKPAAYRRPADIAATAQSAQLLQRFYEEHGHPFLQQESMFAMPRQIDARFDRHTNSAGRRVVTERYAAALQRLWKQPVAVPDAPWLLVATPESAPAQQTAFLQQELAGCFFLSAQPIDSPLCLTPAEVRVARAASRRILFADPEVEALLKKEGLASKLLEEQKASLAGWIKSYPASLFALVAVGQGGTAAVAAGLPEPFRSFLLDPAPCKVGLFSPSVQRVQVHRKYALLEAPAWSPWQRSFRFPASFVLQSLDAQQGRSSLIINRTQNLPLTEAHGVYVSVYDPESGRVLKSGLFSGPELVECQLREVEGGMLFNSFPFLFVFLPGCLLGYFGLARLGAPRLANLFLVLASLGFYGWWRYAAPADGEGHRIYPYVGLLCASTTLNYLAGAQLGRSQSRLLLGGAIAANLAVLGYFKYSAFAVSVWQGLHPDSHHAPLRVILPLAISFYTFTQIAFLVDAYRGLARELSFARYGLFVFFFPHLIAGPIVHHSEIMPQFARPGSKRWQPLLVSGALCWLSLGLFKKVVIADSIAPLANDVFGHPEHLSCLEAWAGVLAYAFQIYFDFSGYSDMAIGLSLLFNVRLPDNFDAPYRALDIVDFWRRWHITLSRFLRDYLYIPLGGNRLGPGRRYANLLLTMTLGGLWHGAGWQYLWWGVYHGLLLTGCHLWKGLRRPLPAGLSRGLTFVAVLCGWALFRARSVGEAGEILSAMGRLNDWRFQNLSTGVTLDGLAALAALLVFVNAAPTTKRWIESRALGSRHGFGMALLFCTALFLMRNVHLHLAKSEFIYFQF